MSPLKKALPSTAAVLGTLAFALAACSSTPEEARTEEATTPEALDEAADAEAFPEVVARVNGAEIAKEDLLERVEGMEAQGSTEVRSLELYRRVLGELIGAELLFQASQERNLKATPEEVDRQLESMRSRFPSPKQFEEALASEGLTLEELREQVLKNMSIQKLVETDIAPEVRVTDEEARKFYDENSEEMRQPERLRVRHILKRVAPDAGPEVRAAARTAAETVREQASSGSDFAALAREHSEDPGSAANGGELVIGRGETVPPFEEAAFALEPGGLSPVVETQFGFHVIELQERIAGQLVLYDQVRARIQDFLRQRGIQERIESRVETMKKSAEVEVLI